MKKQEDIEQAREWAKSAGLKPGMKVFTVLRNRRGDNRRISLLIWDKENERFKSLDHLVRLCGIGRPAYYWNYGERSLHEGNVVSGGGQDMGFYMVYELGRCLYPDGVSEGYDGAPKSDGGYAFGHVWI